MQAVGEVSATDRCGDSSDALGRITVRAGTGSSRDLGAGGDPRVGRQRFDLAPGHRARGAGGSGLRSLTVWHPGWELRQKFLGGESESSYPHGRIDNDDERLPLESGLAAMSRQGLRELGA
jgi:hypothetical protein